MRVEHYFVKDHLAALSALALTPPTLILLWIMVSATLCRYVRALGAFYFRLVGKPVDVYQ